MLKELEQIEFKIKCTKKKSSQFNRKRAGKEEINAVGILVYSQCLIQQTQNIQHKQLIIY